MSLPIVPPAPGLLSTTTGWPNATERYCMASRPVESVPPPGGRATMQRIGRLGQVSARATAGAASATAAPLSRVRRDDLSMDTFDHGVGEGATSAGYHVIPRFPVPNRPTPRTTFDADGTG